MLPRRLQAVGPKGEPRWVKVYVRPFGGRWVAMILGEDEQPPARDELKGVGIIGNSPAHVEAEALRYLGITPEASEGEGDGENA